MSSSSRLLAPASSRNISFQRSTSSSFTSPLASASSIISRRNSCLCSRTRSRLSSSLARESALGVSPRLVSSDRVCNARVASTSMRRYASSSRHNRSAISRDGLVFARPASSSPSSSSPSRASSSPRSSSSQPFFRRIRIDVFFSSARSCRARRRAMRRRASSSSNSSCTSRAVIRRESSRRGARESDARVNLNVEILHASLTKVSVWARLFEARRRRIRVACHAPSRRRPRTRRRDRRRWWRALVGRTPRR